MNRRNNDKKDNQQQQGGFEERVVKIKRCAGSCERWSPIQFCSDGRRG